MEYFDPGEAAQAAKYAFKCHRRNEGGKEAIFPINSMAFHPVLGTFATGGELSWKLLKRLKDTADPVLPAFHVRA